MIMNEQNQKFDIDSLNLIKQKIERNIENVDDYELLDYFIYSATNSKDYILKKLRENGYGTYELFLIQKRIIKNDKLVNGTLYGYIMGSIGYLEDFLKYI
jgi:hypothetical protein